MHAAVVPLGRPGRVDAVVALAARNPGVHFILVENGPGIGAVPAGACVDVVRSAASAGAARNVGVQRARELHCDIVSFLDDDDYYGPDYLDEARIALESRDVVHKGIGFVRLPDGLHLFEHRRAYRTMLGNSLSARVDACPSFTECSSGEELAFTAEARRRGLREDVLPPFGFVYDRSQAGHAYVCSPIQFLRAHGPAAFLGALPDTAVDLVARPSDEAVFQDLEDFARAS
jgi:hypothetical protein